MTLKVLLMNNPFRDLETELAFLAEMGADGVELTIEPPKSYLEDIPKVSKELLAQVKIGHSRYDLRFAGGDQRIRDEAVEEFMLAMNLAAELGLPMFNYHPDRGGRKLPLDEAVRRNINCLEKIVPVANSLGIKLSIENQAPVTDAGSVKNLLDAFPDTLLLYDLAHSFYQHGVAEFDRYLELLGDRLGHVHITDNRGDHDDHFFLGYGKLPYVDQIRALSKHTVVSGCVTIESFRVADPIAGVKLVEQSDRGALVKDSIAKLRAAIAAAS